MSTVTNIKIIQRTKERIDNYKVSNIKYQQQGLFNKNVCLKDYFSWLISKNYFVGWSLLILPTQNFLHSILISVYLPSLSVILLFVCHVSRVTGSGPGTHVMKCYIGNCTTFEECRRPELISDCPNDQLYDACTSIIVQKGKSEDCTYSFWCDPSYF